jgi:hypothetical protein
MSGTVENAFSPDDKYLFATNKIYETATWTELGKLTANTTSVVFAPDGKSLLITTDTDVLLLVVPTLEMRSAISHYRIDTHGLSSAVSPDGHFAASGGNGTIMGGFGAKAIDRYNLTIWRLPQK